MNSFGEVGQQQANDCTFQFGKVMNAPVKVSWFLVIMFVYQLVEAFQQARGEDVWWFPILYAGVAQIIMICTVLVHECGHGSMARALGGTVAQILLWPFGGICFSTRPAGIFDGRQKVKNELKIVVAGPATHFVQGPLWVLILYALKFAWKLELSESLWWLMVPLANTAGITQSWAVWQLGSWHMLLWRLCCWGATINLYLFLFNVFFPMYPMDSAKILVCSMQLCGARAVTAAKTLVYLSVPMAFYLIYRAVRGQGGGQGFMQGLTAYMAIMCLMEAYKIWSLMKKRQLHTHYLFELARSDTTYEGNTRRFNTSDYDDDANAQTRGNNNRSTASQHSNYVLFHGDGDRLGAGASQHGSPKEPKTSNVAAPPSQRTMAAASATTPPVVRPDSGGNYARSDFLSKLEKKENDKKKSVRELTEERMEEKEASNRV